MTDDTLQEQAEQLECLLPKLMRRLFTLEADHPAMELPLAQLRMSLILYSGPRPITSLSEEMSISVSAATQIADRLERAGMVERVSDNEDRRIKNLRLTTTGAEIMRSRQETRVRRAAETLAGVPEATRKEAVRIIQALLDASIATTPKFPDKDTLSARLEQ
jgi:DNA-binding MarR family transcriptional regulator